jgi:hypothetical protein
MNRYDVPLRKREDGQLVTQSTVLDNANLASVEELLPFKIAVHGRILVLEYDPISTLVCDFV